MNVAWTIVVVQDGIVDLDVGRGGLDLERSLRLVRR